jgi:transposase-like protein
MATARLHQPAVQLTRKRAIEREAKEHVEAKGMFRLVKNGESVESIRSMIGDNSPYRRKVKLAFDILVAHQSRNGKGVRKNEDTRALSQEVKTQVREQLLSGAPQKEVRETLGVGPQTILQAAKETRASYLKAGRGRRIDPAVKLKIKARIVEGDTMASICRSFGVSDYVTDKLRRALGGEFKKDRRRRRRLSPEQIEQATAMLTSGKSWPETCAAFGVTWKTISAYVKFRKRQTRFSAENAAACIEDLRALARKYSVTMSRLRTLAKKA